MTFDPPRESVEGVGFDGLTLMNVLNHLENDGFTGQFVGREGSIVECTTCHTRTPAPKMAGDHRLIRIEGVSDPADMMAIAALRCPSCGTLGTLVLGYGPEASGVDIDVLRCLDVPPPGG